ncbi:unnamed protein product [Dovyalis caffra]|uniref:Uncharacterized protein n=1 Tax=Dovyalis caffra TaxID=77055 RepID=A0AAV1SKR7_9ROSI|nr:unnamed protein product [Dovyalis caffra]
MEENDLVAALERLVYEICLFVINDEQVWNNNEDISRLQHGLRTNHYIHGNLNTSGRQRILDTYESQQSIQDAPA